MSRRVSEMTTEEIIAYNKEILDKSLGRHTFRINDLSLEELRAYNDAKVQNTIDRSVKIAQIAEENKHINAGYVISHLPQEVGYAVDTFIGSATPSVSDLIDNTVKDITEPFTSGGMNPIILLGGAIVALLIIKELK